MISLHSHSGQYCCHAHGTLDQVIAKVIEQKYKVFGMSEHMPRSRPQDLYQDELDCNYTIQDLHDKFETYYHHAKHIQATTTTVELLVGMEIEWIHQNTFQEIMEMQKKYEFDYLIGSIHHVNQIPIDFSLELYEKVEQEVGGPTQLYSLYFDSQYDMLQKVKPLIIGHFDLIRMWKNVTIDDIVWMKIKRNIEFITLYGGLVEINSRAWKKGLPGAYPLPDILTLMIQSGIKFTISDDSHGPNDIGMHYDKLKLYLETNGITTIYSPKKVHDGISIVEWNTNELF